MHIALVVIHGYIIGPYYFQLGIPFTGLYNCPENNHNLQSLSILSAILTLYIIYITLPHDVRWTQNGKDLDCRLDYSNDSGSPISMYMLSFSIPCDSLMMENDGKQFKGQYLQPFFSANHMVAFSRVNLLSSPLFIAVASHDNSMIPIYLQCIWNDKISSKINIPIWARHPDKVKN